MFVMNCTVDKEEVLRYKTANKRKQNRHRKKARQMRRADPRPASLARAKDSGDIRHLASRQAAWELGAMPHFRRRREGATIPGVSGPCDLPRRREGATIPGARSL
ncbi:hypothetical protein G5714_024584 [Onychostoma macrolepis]|uniref:Uncharacterized protein n=1 Tax=Onychostoma macrolepis TaxID=369639 RepID=A0A7J6BHE3_9TELE|nr:hypothetical protein G5714_024584 [Onychostoma macrolepis]